MDATLGIAINQAHPARSSTCLTGFDSLSPIGSTLECQSASAFIKLINFAAAQRNDLIAAQLLGNLIDFLGAFKFHKLLGEGASLLP